MNRRSFILSLLCIPVIPVKPTNLIGNSLVAQWNPTEKQKDFLSNDDEWIIYSGTIYGLSDASYRPHYLGIQRNNGN